MKKDSKKAVKMEEGIEGICVSFALLHFNSVLGGSGDEA